MSKKQNPDIEELKERIQIPVEEEIEDLKDEAKKKQNGGFDIIEELTSLGQQFAEALESAWSSEERQRFETEVREGVQSFVDEVDKVIRDTKSGEATEKVRTTAADVKEKVDIGDVGEKARGGFVQGLRWLSDELANLADQFNPPQKVAEDVVETAVSPDDFTVINGIGPTFAKRLHAAGIHTFAQLAALSSDELKAITKAANPDEWIKQAAKLA